MKIIIKVKGARIPQGKMGMKQRPKIVNTVSLIASNFNGVVDG